MASEVKLTHGSSVECTVIYPPASEINAKSSLVKVGDEELSLDSLIVAPGEVGGRRLRQGMHVLAVLRDGFPVDQTPTIEDLVISADQPRKNPDWG